MPSFRTMSFMENKLNIDIKNKTYIIPHIGDEYKNNLVKSKFRKKLVYFGDLNSRAAVPFIKAVKKAYNDFPEDFKGVVCFGTHHVIEFKNMLMKYKAEEIFDIRPPIEYNESLKKMKESEILLIIEANMKESPFCPSKLFDYLFSNRPILAISPEKNSLNEYYNGKDLIITTHDEKKIYDIIRKLFVEKIFKKQVFKRNLNGLNKKEIIGKYLKITNNHKINN